MLHAFFRAATVALLGAVAVLVYINYFHSSGSQSDLTIESLGLEAPPELPRLAPNAETLVPLSGAEVNADFPDAAALTNTPTTSTTRNSRIEAAGSVEAGPLAEVVELPAAPRHRAATSNVAQAAPQVTGRRTHVVQSGESLWSISKKYYGKAELLNKIAEGNGITTHDRIRAGQIIVIPDLNGIVAPPAVAHTPAAPSAVRPVMRSGEEDADHEDPRVTPVSQNRAQVQPAVINVQRDMRTR